MIVLRGRNRDGHGEAEKERRGEEVRELHREGCEDVLSEWKMQPGAEVNGWMGGAVKDWADVLMMEKEYAQSRGVRRCYIRISAQCIGAGLRNLFLVLIHRLDRLTDRLQVYHFLPFSLQLQLHSDGCWWPKLGIGAEHITNPAMVLRDD